MKARGLIRDITLVLSGSAALYATMAACAGGATGDAPGGAGPADASFVDVLRDALGSLIDGPVGDANAQTQGPTVVTAMCSTPVTSGGVTIYWAEAAFPGKSVTDLAHVAALFPLDLGRDAASPNEPAGYTTGVNYLLALKPGGAAAECGSGTSNGFPVTFVLP